MWIDERITRVILCIAMCALSAQSCADENVVPLYEQKIKAGLVYNLLKYTQWPTTFAAQSSETKTPDHNGAAKLQVCLFGADPFDGYLSPLEGRTAQQAQIVITTLSEIAQTEHCRVVIIHRSQAQQLEQLLQFLHGKNVLTISDIVQFAEQGGMVELARQDEKISLRINKHALNSTKLTLDPRMLNLAKIVPGKGGA